ncbi:MAG: hypothetical protein GTO13_09200 [Proteobacteria bacterium]|nr:hypothetical protein [Pseudomonadota bacterium]
MSRNLSWMVILILAILMSPVERKDAIAGEKTVVGWLERVYLSEYEFVLTAKIDTGAKNSSIHAMDVEYTKKGKAKGSRIRFKTMDRKGRYQIIEADVLREARIRGLMSATKMRPEIELEICLGGIKKRIRVNLTDRRGRNYRMILGRTALEGDFIVDVSKKFVAGSSCRRP